MNLLENLVISFFLNLIYNESLYYLVYSCMNLIFGKNLVPEIRSKYYPPIRLQDSYRTKRLKSLIFSMLTHIHGNQKLIKKYWAGKSQSALSTLKLVVCQEGPNEINWFLMCWYKFMKAKSYFNNFWEVEVQNGRDLLGFGTLKSAVSQELLDKMSWLFACCSLHSR